MPRLISPDDVYKYRLLSDKEAGVECYFHLKPLTHKDGLKLTQTFRLEMRRRSQSQTIVHDSEELKKKVFLSSVVKVEGLTWPGESDPVIIEDVPGLEKLWGMLSDADGQEILDAVQDVSILEAGEIKN